MEIPETKTLGGTFTFPDTRCPICDEPLVGQIIARTRLKTDRKLQAVDALRHKTALTAVVRIAMHLEHDCPQPAREVPVIEP